MHTRSISRLISALAHLQYAHLLGRPIIPSELPFCRDLYKLGIAKLFSLARPRSFHFSVHIHIHSRPTRPYITICATRHRGGLAHAFGTTTNVNASRVGVQDQSVLTVKVLSSCLLVVHRTSHIAHRTSLYLSSTQDSKLS